MKTWLKQLDVSTALQLLLAISALFCLFIGVVGLYTLQQQRSEMDFAIDRNFPAVQAAFRTEEQINLVENAFLSLKNIDNTEEKIRWVADTQHKLAALQHTIAELNPAEDNESLAVVKAQSALLETLSDNMDEQLILNSRLNKSLSEIEWLHNDFHDEFIALLQEITWQQSTLANQMTDSAKDRHHMTLLRKFQSELLLVYDFLNYEEQIVAELKARTADQAAPSPRILENYLHYLKGLVDQKIGALDRHSSTYSIKQIMDDLLAVGLNEQALPRLLAERQRLALIRRQLLDENESLIERLRGQISSQVGDNQKQLQRFHHLIDTSTKINGFIILCAMLLLFVFIFGMNFLYIRRRLITRFHSLNQSVERLIDGEADVQIAVRGNDELGRIAKLLRLFLFEAKAKNDELNLRNITLLNEINERKAVQEKLVSTQNELIQAAKLAVVGQTMTSINHEITQPLNAMSAYVFSAKRAVKNNDVFSVETYLDKIAGLIERTALVVKRLRHFSRQRTDALQAVDLAQSIRNAWELLEPKRKGLNARLSVPPDLPLVVGDEVLLEQVFVNIFLNALEAAQHAATEIHIDIRERSAQRLTLWVADNGTGWPLTEKLLQPFSGTKSVNLGLGLSISLSIMRQCGGDLFIASTLARNALVILEFEVVKHV